MGVDLDADLKSPLFELTLGSQTRRRHRQLSKAHESKVTAVHRSRILQALRSVREKKNFFWAGSHLKNSQAQLMGPLWSLFGPTFGFLDPFAVRKFCRAEVSLDASAAPGTSRAECHTMGFGSKERFERTRLFSFPFSFCSLAIRLLASFFAWFFAEPKPHLYINRDLQKTMRYDTCSTHWFTGAVRRLARWARHPYKDTSFLQSCISTMG